MKIVIICLFAVFAVIAAMPVNEEAIENKGPQDFEAAPVEGESLETAETAHHHHHHHHGGGYGGGYGGNGGGYGGGYGGNRGGYGGGYEYGR